MPKSRSLTILLLKGEAVSATELIRIDAAAKGALEHRALTIGSQPYLLSILKTLPRPPRWAEFFRHHLTPGELGSVSTATAALLGRVAGSWFAVTFGQGRHLLRPEAIVKSFGLRVTLNAVAEGSLKSIDKETFDAMADHSRRQASRATDSGEFGIDVERDLVHAVTGSPRDPALGERLSGMDALSVTAQITIENLADLLAALRRVYREDTYRRTFPWVDNIRAIDDPELARTLDQRVLAAVGHGDFSNTWIAPPEVLDWSAVRFFGYSDADRAHVFTDLHWRTFLRSCRRSTLSRETLKRRRAFCFGEDRVILRDWLVYDCIYAEIEHEGVPYLLSGGSWYRVAGDFVADLNAWFDAFPKAESTLPTYDHKSESLYNQHVAAASRGHYALLDRRLIPRSGGQSPIELCDLLGLDGEMVHVKRYAGSKPLSHLFAQGLVVGELLREDQRFRDALRDFVPRMHWRTCSLADGSARSRRITFAIIYRSRGPFVLPLFARVAFRQTARRLSRYGYSVLLTRIAMNETRANLEMMKADAF
jgi:uncharacterized protein (TIGR04141 family)